MTKKTNYANHSTKRERNPKEPEFIKTQFKEKLYSCPVQQLEQSNLFIVKITREYRENLEDILPQKDQFKVQVMWAEDGKHPNCTQKNAKTNAESSLATGGQVTLLMSKFSLVCCMYRYQIVDWYNHQNLCIMQFSFRIQLFPKAQYICRLEQLQQNTTG